VFRPQAILHPTDYSECANFAFEVALDLARQYGAQLLILHVAETLGAEKVTNGEASSKRQPAAQQLQLREQLQKVQPPPGSGIAVRHLLEEGDPGTAIANVAAREHCDLVVMGTYGRNIVSRLLSGSVTQKVSHHVTCPLLTVRVPNPTAS
jgi:nucleotide-binding universal stress UspA family protein